jgi:3-hydroxybutyryl-CoA dehydrogenase
MGLFRRMDFEGLRDYPVIFENIFPKLSNRENIPHLMQEIIDQQARGTQNAKGLYSYTEEEAKQWNEAFSSFNLDIYNLAKEYPADLGKHSYEKPED